MAETQDAPVVGADLAEARSHLPASLTRKPVIDSVPEEMLQLITARANAGSKAPVTKGELSAFLELAAAYELDPFAGEVWLAKASNDRVLIMVGRDGLRRVASRSGMRVVCDVIHKSDSFGVVVQNGEHRVTHGYQQPADRGEIVGAWAQVFDAANVERGFYIAMIDEFKPENEKQLKYSPWGAQESVMILAAAERQALRQATPLSGLVAQGELDRGEELAENLPSAEEEAQRMNALAVSFPPGTCAMLSGVYDRAREIRYENFTDVGTLELTLLNQEPGFVEQWCRDADDEMDRFEAERAPAEAEVVGDPPPRCGAVDPSRPNTRCALATDHDGPHYANDQTWDAFVAEEAKTSEELDAHKAAALRDQANELLDRAGEAREKIAAPDPNTPEHLLASWGGEADEMEQEAEAKRQEADRLDPPSQDELGEGF